MVPSPSTRNLQTTPIKTSATSQQGAKRRRFQRRNSQSAQMMIAACKQCCGVEVAGAVAPGSPRGVRSPLFKMPKGDPIGMEQTQRLFDAALRLIDAKDIDINAFIARTATKDTVLVPTTSRCNSASSTNAGNNSTTSKDRLSRRA